MTRTCPSKVNCQAINNAWDKKNFHVPTTILIAATGPLLSIFASQSGQLSDIPIGSIKSRSLRSGLVNALNRRVSPATDDQLACTWNMVSHRERVSSTFYYQLLANGHPTLSRLDDRSLLTNQQDAVTPPPARSLVVLADVDYSYEIFIGE